MELEVFKDMRNINEIKRDIFDGYKMGKIRWNGEMSEIDFLSRLYDLTSLPSTDSRYENMSQDIWQHCINNDDWEQWWVINDDRLQLNDLDRLKRFICETTHPLVCSDTDMALTIVEHVNQIFTLEGLTELLVPIKTFWGKPVFDFRKNGDSPSVMMEQHKVIASTFVEEQIKKCEEKLQSSDHDGAITNARSMLEGVFGDIHERITGKPLPESGDLKDDFKCIQKLLNLSHEQQSSNAAKGVISGLSSILSNIDTMSNKMGDRHRPLIRAERHHAKLCINTAISISDFLYATLVFQNGSTIDLQTQIIEILDSDLRLMPRHLLVANPKIQILTRKLDGYVSRILIDRFMVEFDIPTFNGYRNNDIFFAAMNILFNELTAMDIDKVYIKCVGNGQAVGLSFFLRSIEKDRTDLILSDIIKEHLLAQPE